MTSAPNSQFLGLISDTHGHKEFTQQALRILEPFSPVAYLHAGDIGGPAIIRLFPERSVCHFVKGNCDYDTQDLEAEAESLGYHWGGEFSDLIVGGLRIALLHGDDSARLTQAIRSQTYDLVIHGHTHSSRDDRSGSTRIINPGAVYRANPATVAVFDLVDRDLQLLKIR